MMQGSHCNEKMIRPRGGTQSGKVKNSTKKRIWGDLSKPVAPQAFVIERSSN